MKALKTRLLHLIVPFSKVIEPNYKQIYRNLTLQGNVKKYLDLSVAGHPPPMVFRAIHRYIAILKWLEFEKSV